MKLISMDNSDPGHLCQAYVTGLAGGVNEVYRFNENTGHAKALNFAMGYVQTPLALIMDSDTIMLKDPLEEMLRLMKRDTYGVGWVTEIGRDGYDFGTYVTQTEAIKYLHPYFCLVSLKEFYLYSSFIHHGNPFSKAMIELHDLRQSHRLKHFKGLTGHTNGKGSNWVGTPSEYVQHDFGGTRKELRRSGRQEIEGKWEKCS